MAVKKLKVTGITTEDIRRNTERAFHAAEAGKPLKAKKVVPQIMTAGGAEAQAKKKRKGRLSTGGMYLGK